MSEEKFSVVHGWAYFGTHANTHPCDYEGTLIFTDDVCEDGFPQWERHADGSPCAAAKTSSVVVCRHCKEPLLDGTEVGWTGGWTHANHLYRCQQRVTYGHNAAHPDIPCEPGVINACRCTYAPDPTAKGDEHD